MKNFLKVIYLMGSQQNHYFIYSKLQPFLAPMFQYQVLVQTLDPCEEYVNKEIQELLVLNLNTFLQVDNVFFELSMRNHSLFWHQLMVEIRSVACDLLDQYYLGYKEHQFFHLSTYMGYLLVLVKSNRQNWD